MGAKWRRARRRVQRVTGSRAGRLAVLPVVAAAAMIVALAGSPASTVAARRAAGAPQAQTRYSLVHGCYALSSPSRGTPIGADEIGRAHV